jgi:hypothetical protein
MEKSGRPSPGHAPRESFARVSLPWNKAPTCRMRTSSCSITPHLLTSSIARVSAVSVPSHTLVPEDTTIGDLQSSNPLAARRDQRCRKGRVRDLGDYNPGDAWRAGACRPGRRFPHQRPTEQSPNYEGDGTGQRGGVVIGSATEQPEPHRPAPLISLIIPTYNAAATLLQTIDSIRLQTFSDFELIVIDDGSTDPTHARAQSVQDPRVRISTYPNQGLASSRNRGIELSRGEFLAFIDADDLWTPRSWNCSSTRCAGIRARHWPTVGRRSWTRPVASCLRRIRTGSKARCIHACSVIISWRVDPISLCAGAAPWPSRVSMRPWKPPTTGICACELPPNGSSRSCPAIRFSIAFQRAPCLEMPCEPNETACCCLRKASIESPAFRFRLARKVFRT